MIVFQTLSHQIDFSNLPITFNEKNAYFSDHISKSFSFPFTVKITEDLVEKLQMVIVNNVVKYESKIYGTLIKDHVFFDAYLAINNVVEDTVELTLFYGTETLRVFDKNLNQLPFPVVFVTPTLRDFAKTQLTKSWPDATHNFPKIYRPDIKDEPDYDKFNLFLNNYSNNGVTSNFIENSTEVLDGEDVIFNRNVMAPMPYLLEILKTGFKSEGLDISGDFVKDEMARKLVLVPQNYFEQYAQTEFAQYSFSDFNTQQTIDGNTINVYKRIHLPTQEGSYSISFRLNFSNALAKYFSLTITQGEKTLYSAFSENKEVVLEKNVDINLEPAEVYEDIVVELKLNYQAASISNFNSFTYDFKQGKVNQFPTLYNLADFMPDLTFREFTNRIKTWFNLKFDYTNTTVNINYLDKELERLTFDNHSHLQDVAPKRTLNKNNLFKLSYNSEDMVMVDKDGQTFTDSDFTDSETQKIEIKGMPLRVKENYGYITGVYPEKDTDIMLVIYDGLQNNFNHTVDAVSDKSLLIESIYNNYYKQWLRFRANSETVNDSFFMPVSEVLNLKKGSFKYNKHHIIKKVERLRVNEQWWRVKVESETL